MNAELSENIAAIPTINSIIKPSLIWVYLCIVFSVVYMGSTGEGISVEEIIAAVLYDIGIMVWFVHKIFIVREKIVESIADWLILFFFFGVTINSVIAAFNGVNMLKWLNEYLSLLPILLYFPIKHHIKTKRELSILMILLAFVALVVSGMKFYAYYKDTIREAMYAFQLASSARINLALFVTGGLGGILFAVTEKKAGQAMLFLAVGMISTGASIVSFARTYWVAFAVGLLIMFIALPRRNRLKILFATIIITILTALILNFFFKERTMFFYKIAEERLSSSTKGMKDVSLLDRISEAKSFRQKIAQNPIAGNGLAAEFTYNSPVYHHSVTTSFMHNGYFYIIYRLGFPLASIFFFWIIYYFYRSAVNLHRFRDIYSLRMNLAAFLSLFVLFASNILTAQFTMRDGIILLAIAPAIIVITERINSNKYNTCP